MPMMSVHVVRKMLLAVTVPKLVPHTDDQIRRFANGKERRAIRAELEERHRELHKK